VDATAEADIAVVAEDQVEAVPDVARQMTALLSVLLNNPRKRRPRHRKAMRLRLNQPARKTAIRPSVSAVGDDASQEKVRKPQHLLLRKLSRA
jgi:hypothetical protein